MVLLYNFTYHWIAAISTYLQKAILMRSLNWSAKKNRAKLRMCFAVFFLVSTVNKRNHNKIDFIQSCEKKIWYQHVPKFKTQNHTFKHYQQEPKIYSKYSCYFFFLENFPLYWIDKMNKKFNFVFTLEFLSKEFK